MEASRISNGPQRLLFAVTLVLLVWNVALHVKTSRQLHTLGQVQLELRGLTHRHVDRAGTPAIRKATRSLALTNERTEGNVFGDSPNTMAPVIEEYLTPKDLNNKYPKDRLMSSGSKRRKRATNPNKGKGNETQNCESGKGAHFVPGDEDSTTTAGTREDDGSFTPDDLIYRIWEPTKWSCNRSFALNRTTGKVTIRQSGYYLLYSQIVYSDTALRKSYGIYVNDAQNAIATALAYDILTKNSSAVESKATANHFTSQCNIVTATYLEEEDQVFLKSSRTNRSIILQSFLTFWGIAKL